MRESVEVLLGLGSNLGDRLAHLREARRRLGAWPGLEVVASSPVYETEPVGVRADYRELLFLNAVLVLRAALPADALSAAVHGVEAAMGRLRADDRNAPRPIDIDVLYIEGFTGTTPDLLVPHPQWSRRRFVAQPLADVRPDLAMPGETRTCAAVLATLPATPAVSLFASTW